MENTHFVTITLNMFKTKQYKREGPIVEQGTIMGMIAILIRTHNGKDFIKK